MVFPLVLLKILNVPILIPGRCWPEPTYTPHLTNFSFIFDLSLHLFSFSYYISTFFSFFVFHHFFRTTWLIFGAERIHSPIYRPLVVISRRRTLPRWPARWRSPSARRTRTPDHAGWRWGIPSFSYNRPEAFIQLLQQFLNYNTTELFVLLFVNRTQLFSLFSSAITTVICSFLNHSSS
jgi:hypothetical protein